MSARRSPSQTDTSPHVATNTPSGHKDAILSDEQSRGCRSKPSPFLFLFFPSLPLLLSPRRLRPAGNTLYQETIHRVERVSPFCVTRSDKKQMKSFEFFWCQEINQCALALGLHALCDGLCNPSGVRKFFRVPPLLSPATLGAKGDKRNAEDEEDDQGDDAHLG